MLPPPSGNFTKLYNDYIDEYLYLMTPYEVVVFLFVLRHTHGFQRASAKFSYSVLRDGFYVERDGGDDSEKYEGTGLSYSTIKKALDGLVEYGFLIRGKVSKAGTQYAVGNAIQYNALVKRHADKLNKGRKKLRHAVRAQDDDNIEETAYIMGRLPDARPKNDTQDSVMDGMPDWLDGGYRLDDIKRAMQALQDDTPDSVMDDTQDDDTQDDTLRF